MPKEPNSSIFSIFVETAIINQLATSSLESCLPNGMMAPHFAVLNHLIRLGDGQTPLEVSRALQVPKNSFTHTLSGLVARKLVEVRANPNDRRSKHIWITKKGCQARDVAVEALDPLFKNILEQTNPGTLDGLLPQLRELRKVMDELRDGKDS